MWLRPRSALTAIATASAAGKPGLEGRRHRRPAHREPARLNLPMAVETATRIPTLYRSSRPRSRTARYVMGRLLIIPIGVFVVVTGTFFIVSGVPSDPARTVLGDSAAPAQIAAFNHKYDLDESLPDRYVNYLGELVRGNLGDSYYTWPAGRARPRDPRDEHRRARLPGHRPLVRVGDRPGRDRRPLPRAASSTAASKPWSRSSRRSRSSSPGSSPPSSSSTCWGSCRRRSGSSA